MPLIPQPFMPRAVLMQHHAKQRLAFAPPAVRPTPLRLLNLPAALQRQAHEVVGSPSSGLLIFAVKMLHRPAPIAAAVLFSQRHHFIYRCSPPRQLPDTSINQSLQPIGLVAATLAPKLPFTYPQNLCRLFLRQPTLC